MPYPMMMYRRGWEDIHDNIVVHDEEGEKSARLSGFKHMEEFSSGSVVAETPQIDNNATTKRRGRPPKVRHDDSGPTD